MVNAIASFVGISFIDYVNYMLFFVALIIFYAVLPNNTDSSHDLSNLPSTSQDPNMLTITGSNLIGGVSQVLRNANLQVRSEPANPRVDVGPWQNTTIEPDLSRISFELGSTCGN